MHLQWKEEKAGQGWDGGGSWGIEGWDRWGGVEGGRWVGWRLVL